MLTLFPEAVVVIPVSPEIVRVSVSRSIVPEPLSPAKFKSSSDAVTCPST